jgi:hypothetical protein
MASTINPSATLLQFARNDAAQVIRQDPGRFNAAMRWF